jgi:inner membrane protein
VENLCHTLVGAALARAGLDRLSPLATPVAVVAANLPDVDVVSMWWGDLAYLEHHRGITHSALGLAVQAPVLAALGTAWDRLVRRRRDPDAAPARFGGLTIVSAAGLASHTLLDYTNSYGVKPWLPFDDTWYYGDIVFVVDPWLWLVLGGALFVGAARTWWRTALWTALFAVLAVAVVVANSLAPHEAVGAAPVALWLVLLASILAVRFAWRGPPARGLAAAALATVVVYWGGLAVAQRVAASRFAVAVPVADVATAIPTLMRPDRWRGLAVAGGHLRVGEVWLGRPAGVATVAIAQNLADPPVVSALATCAGAVARDFNRFMFAEIAPRSDGRTTVLLRDARFAALRGRADFATTAVTLDADLRPVADTRPCPKCTGSW